MGHSHAQGWASGSRVRVLRRALFTFDSIRTGSTEAPFGNDGADLWIRPTTANINFRHP
ncbi:hypothetical protein CPAR01_02024 [Colletotrichum paranaense]|uniref:Uncharacterized protein n=5 Tax=Colletotrichum acutatum species complex TaxID=2707335 RepID=A0A9Q8SCK3_9PEZI|nr:uncharacterized protein CLUP02_01559 [Colletotrichum lupini]XP_060317770.1 uncharacterized protein CCOS01_03319 [Colletotrichum costaricense]XP_060353640.1 uncharacterized protein CPAR01_02024 [Colletotrichum paranaense]KAI3535040.1 hypothetical protein CSPX01_11730 [Colletotrichum filicis]KAK1458303.1 hypothetical protein CCUS01_09402 [Colletotrichum cuscutae]KAK1459729.1 hypothetical protein CMEL01_02728 [Colletotrichum melonis]KAK1534567.1 hypothetical protein CCOS01_03319 [Colletotrich